MQNYKILLVIGNTIGDSVCFTPAIRALKEINPDFTLDVLTLNKAVAQMYAVNPDINKICPVPSKEAMKEMAAYYDFAIAFPMATECF